MNYHALVHNNSNTSIKNASKDEYKYLKGHFYTALGHLESLQGLAKPFCFQQKINQNPLVHIVLLVNNPVPLHSTCKINVREYFQRSAAF